MVTTPEALDRQLHDFMRLDRQVMKRFFSDCGLFNGHPFMLFLIRQQPGITPAALAKQMEIAPASATISLKRMETAGLLRRVPDERDRRVLHLFLTPAGEAMDDLCLRGKDFMADTLFEGFSAEEREQFAGMLARMQQNLTKADTAAWLRQQTQKEDAI